MKINTSNQAVYLTLVTSRKRKDKLLCELSNYCARVISTIYGKGTVKASYLKDAFGLLPEENKVIISCVMRKDKADEVMQSLIDKFGFDKPNTGIAFTTNLDKLSF